MHLRIQLMKQNIKNQQQNKQIKKIPIHLNVLAISLKISVCLTKQICFYLRRDVKLYFILYFHQQ